MALDEKEISEEKPAGGGGAAESTPARPRRAGVDSRTLRKPKGFLFVAVLLTALVGIATIGNLSDPRGVEWNTYKAQEYLHADKLEIDSMEMIRDTRTFRARLKAPQGDVKNVRVEFATEGEMDGFRKQLDLYNERRAAQGLAAVDWKTKDSNAALWTIFWGSVPWILFLVILYYLFIRQLRAPGTGGNVLTFGRSRAKLATRESTGVTFSDVAGIQEAKEEVVEIIEFLKNPQRFQKLGGRIPRGIMLVGSPGTGKTLLAKAIAGEAEVPFFSICGSDFVEMFVGVGASRVRDLFRQARENSPCIVFLDEVDAVGRRRGTGFGGGHDEREQTLNAILVEMDGFHSDEWIILVAATNRPDVLDPALLRPGRFDREIVIDLPDLKGREEILRVHGRKVKLDASVSLERIARATPVFSGAELAALVNEAAIIAAMKDQETILEQDLEEARDKLRWGRQKRSRVLMPEDRRITAYHEAGHALVAHLLDDVEPLHKVTIIPRGMALGATMQLPERDRYHLSRKQIMGNLMVLYAGRIAERTFCNDITSGASNDIERATELARRMVCEWGMSEAIGPINYADPEETLFLGREIPRNKHHSETVALRIDEEVRRIVDESYKATEALIREHREAVSRIAEGLLAKETLTGEEVAALVEGTSGEKRVGGSRSGRPGTSTPAALRRRQE